MQERKKEGGIEEEREEESMQMPHILSPQHHLSKDMWGDRSRTSSGANLNPPQNPSLALHEFYHLGQGTLPHPQNKEKKSCFSLLKSPLI